MSHGTMNDEAIFRFFAEANPVSNTAELSADAEPATGRIDMTQQDIRTATPTKPGRSRWALGLAVAAVALLVIGIPALFLAQRGDSVHDAAEQGDVAAIGQVVAEGIYSGDRAEVARWLDPAFGSSLNPVFSTSEELLNLADFYGSGADPRSISISCESAGFGNLVTCLVVAEDPELVLPDDDTDDVTEYQIVDGLVVWTEPMWDLAWIRRLGGIAQSIDPSGFEQACAPKPEVRMIRTHGIALDGECGAFLADYTGALEAALKN